MAEENKQDEFSVIEKFVSLEEATIVKSKLEAYEISSMIKHDTGGIYNMPGGQGFLLLVRKRDFMQARKIISESSVSEE